MRPQQLAERADRTAPLVTLYDGADRVELSAATFGNAVAKAAGLLRDGLGLAPGASVSIDLPLHWQLPVWTVAALAVGARTSRHAAWADARVVGPDGLARIAAGGDPGADEVLASACDAFGMPLRGPLPAGVTDVGVEARMHPDVHAPEPRAHLSAALQVGGEWIEWTTLAASRPASPAGGRVWVGAGVAPERLLWAGVVHPLLTGARLVLAVSLGADATARARAVEAITADAR